MKNNSPINLQIYTKIVCKKCFIHIILAYHLHRKPKGKKRMSYQKIADELNRRGMKPRKANKWEAKTVYNILQRK